MFQVREVEFPRGFKGYASPLGLVAARRTRTALQRQGDFQVLPVVGFGEESDTVEFADSKLMIISDLALFDWGIFTIFEGCRTVGPARFSLPTSR